MLVLIVTVSLFGISAWIVRDGMDLARRHIEEKDRLQRQTLAVSELDALYKRKIIAYQDYLLIRNGGDLNRFDELSAAVREAINGAILAESAEERKQRLEELLKLDDEFNALAAGQMASPDDAARIRDDIFALLDRLLEEEKQGHKLAADQTDSQLRGNALVLVFSIVVSAAVGLTLVILVSRNVNRSLHEVVRMADEIAGKNLRVPDMEHLEKNEIGRLADAMNGMKRTLRDMMESITAASNLVAGESKKLIRFAGRAGEGSREIARTMEHLAGRSQEQAAASSSLAGRMDHFADRILAVADEMDRLDGLSRRMLALTEEGGESMRSSIENMEFIDRSMDRSLAQVRSLEEKTDRISEIVGVIRDIADQTKLVSLERGSGIVKDGKRQMGRTSEAFLELKAQIGQIGEQIGRMSASLDDIRNEMPRIRQFLLDTVALSEETAGGVAEVSAIAGEFDVLLREVENSVLDLDREAGRLSGMVNQFHL